MIQRKKLPTYIYVLLLVGILIVCYFVAGVFCFEDVDFTNFSVYLEYVVTHFYQLWWNDKTPAILLLGFAGWVMLCSWIMQRFRNFHPGMEKGAADWADINAVNRRHRPKKEKSKKSKDEPEEEEKTPYSRILSANIELDLEGSGRLSNNNMVVIGSSGTYKTTSVLMTNVLRCLANYIILDVKGELLRLLGKHLENNGYTVKSLNFLDFEKSMCYNPFVYVETEEDIVRLVQNLQDSIVLPEEKSGDPFWKSAPAMFLQALFYLVWDKSRQEGRVGSIPEVVRYLNMENLPSTRNVGDSNGKPRSQLQDVMEDLMREEGAEYPAVRDYMKVRSGAEDTIKSIVIIANDTLKLFELKAVRRIFQKDELRLDDFAYGVGGTAEHVTNKKCALFLVTPPDSKAYNFICSMLYTQAFNHLMRIAQTDFKKTNGSLPIPLEFWMDEFYEGARPADTPALMGVVRSYNISMIPILQSVSQIQALFPNNKWNILMDNCPVLMFLGCGTGSLDSLEFINKLLDTQTIDIATDGVSGKNGSISYGKEGVSLMGTTGLRTMNKKDLIIFMEGEYPIFDEKALPWEMPQDIVPYDAAMELNKDGGYELEQTIIFDRKHDIMFPIKSEQAILKIPVEGKDGNIIEMPWDDIESDILLYADLHFNEAQAS